MLSTGGTTTVLVDVLVDAGTDDDVACMVFAGNISAVAHKSIDIFLLNNDIGFVSGIVINEENRVVKKTSRRILQLHNHD